MKNYDVVIIGGGVSGTALQFALARYSSVQKILVIEKESDIAVLNSHARNNSQTLHCGDIETNYSEEKVGKIRDAAYMIAHYCDRVAEEKHLAQRMPKMVLGVGEKECEGLRQRFDWLSNYFPAMELWEQEDIARVEPWVVKDRDEEIVALGSEGQVAAVDYKALSESFSRQATQEKEKQVTLQLNEKVLEIQPIENGHRVVTDKGSYNAGFVVVSSGGHSLLFAHAMGHGLEYSCLPVAGSFYYTPQLLNGKVYTVQNDKLPFAAVHGDPDLAMPDKTRFGPTALLHPMLERYNFATMGEFFKVAKVDRDFLMTLWGLMKVSDIRNYILKNLMFEVPVLQRWLFLSDVRKIIPSLTFKDVHFAKGIGGVRPQLIDRHNRQLLLGEAKIDPGTGIIFNMTPSPGATSSLSNAEKDMRTICDYLGFSIDEDRLKQELYTQ